MPYGKEDYAECPHCGQKAFGRDNIEIYFGYRTMEDGNVIPQSYCKDCRVEERRNAR